MFNDLIFISYKMKIYVPIGYKIYTILQSHFANVEFVEHPCPKMHITEVQIDQLLSSAANICIYKFKKVIYVDSLTVPFETGGLVQYVFINTKILSNHIFIPYNIKTDTYLQIYCKRHPLLHIDLSVKKYIENFLVDWYNKIQLIIMKNIDPDFIIPIIINYPGNTLEFIIHISNKLSQIKFEYSYGTQPEFHIAQNSFFIQPIIQGTSHPNNTDMFYSRLHKIIPIIYFWYIDSWPLRPSVVYTIPSPVVLNIKHRFTVDKLSDEFITEICKGLDMCITGPQILIFLNTIFQTGISYINELHTYVDELQYIIESEEQLAQFVNHTIVTSRKLIFENEMGSVFLTDRKSTPSCINGLPLPHEMNGVHTQFLKDGNRRVILQLKEKNIQFINNGLFLAILRMYTEDDIKFKDCIIANSTSTMSPDQLKFTEGEGLYTSYKMSPEAKTLSFLINNNIQDDFLSYVVQKWFSNKSTQSMCKNISIQGKHFDILQPFIDIYWDICKDLSKDKILCITLRQQSPKVIIATLSTNYKGYYDLDNHYIILNEYYHSVPTKDILLSALSFDEFIYIIKNRLCILFSSNVPIPTLIHELLHAIQGSNSTSHGFTKIVNNISTSFDDCAQSIYHLVLDRNIINKYFTQIKCL